MKRIRRNLTNMRFGKLVAVEYAGTDNFRNALWKCQCDCGNTIVEKGTLLTNGKVVSCGQCDYKYTRDTPQKIKVNNSIVGKRYGRLLVLDERVIEERKANADNENGAEKTVKTTVCQCKCDCGNIVDVAKVNLVNNITKSCGCLQKDKIKNSLYRLKEENIGKRIGLLTALSYDIEKKMWKCQCDCGNIIYLKRLNGNTKSCGCLKKMNYEQRRKALNVDALSYEGERKKRKGV